MSKTSIILGKSKLFLKRRSPEILLGLGITGIIASGVLLVKAAMETKDLAATHDAIEENVKRGIKSMPEEEQNKELLKLRFVRALDFGRLYGPALAVGTGSIISIIGSHRIMQKRVVSMVAAYTLLDEGFKLYRKRVVEKLGEEEDLRFRYGTKNVTEEIEYTTKGGKVKTKEVEKEVLQTSLPSIYARIFDEYSPQWQKDPEQNLFFLRRSQDYWNDRLRAKGHVFLNEIWDHLGLPRTDEGAVIGWVFDEERQDGQDNFIDFGLYDLDNGAFINGYETSVLIDPNVNGLIIELSAIRDGLNGVGSGNPMRDLMDYANDDRFIYDGGRYIPRPQKGNLNYD